MKYFLRRVPQASQAKHKRKARRERARQPHKFKEAKELKHIRQGADEMSSPDKLGSLRSYDGCFLNSLLFLNSPLSPQLQNTKASGILVVMWKSSRTIIISNVFKLEWGLYPTESQQTTITIIIPFSSPIKSEGLTFIGLEKGLRGRLNWVNDEPFFKTNSVVQYTIFIFIASLLTSSRTFFENIFNTVNWGHI